MKNKKENMTAPDGMRGFHVITTGKKRVSYPCRGWQPYTISKAIEVMKALEARKIPSVAYTYANGIEENLTIAEMEEMNG